MNRSARQRLLRSLVPALVLAAAGALADNTITIDGSGNLRANVDTREATNSLIDLYQVGPTATGQENQAGTTSAPVTQRGAGHVARIGQGATRTDGAWVPGAAVTGNTAVIRQFGASGDTALIVQTSNNNTATILQNGAAATAAITQGGTGGHTAAIETLSNYIGAGVIVTQTGYGNQAYVTGMTGGSANIDQSGTGGYVSLLNQSSGALTVSQQGTNNGLTVENYGAGVPLSITQTGNGGGSTTFDPNPAPTGPTYTPYTVGQ